MMGFLAPSGSSCTTPGARHTCAATSAGCTVTARVIQGDVGRHCQSQPGSVGSRNAQPGVQSGAHKDRPGHGAPSWLFSLPANLAAPFFLRLPLAKAPLAAAARISSKAEGLHSSI